MNPVDVIPELKQIIGAMLFAAKEPLPVGQIRKTFGAVAESRGGAAKDFAKATDKDIRQALGELKEELQGAKLGFNLVEVARGFRLENDAGCGHWLREMLNRGKPSRLSRPALETLAIIAYRQPCTRAEIETVRGVAVDQIVRNLLDLQLIRAVGRSELPGRPWMFGTTQKFLVHFGLKDVKDLPGIEELKRMENARAEEASKAGDDEDAPQDEVEPDGEDQEDEEVGPEEEVEAFDPEDEFDDDDEDDTDESAASPADDETSAERPDEEKEV